jgi:hypothetical protein
MLVTWMSFASVARELRRGTLITPETHIVMNSLIFCLVLILVRRLACFMDLTITYVVLVHERITLCLDALVTAHILIMVIVSRIGPVFLLEDLILTLSLDTWMIHAFSVVVHVPLDQMVRCYRLLTLPLVVWLSFRFLRFISLTPALSHQSLLVLCR